MQTLSRWLLVVLALHLSVAGTARAVSETDKKERLDLNLERVESDARTRRYVGGIFLLAFGAAAGIGAVVAHSSTDPYLQSTGAAVLGVTGGVFVILGAVTLFVPTVYERLPESYGAMPSGTPEQLHAKVLRGEAYLRRLSEEAKRSRILEGILGIAIGGAYIVIGAANNTSFNQQWLIYGGAAVAGLGIADLLIERVPEREYDDYSAWRGEKVSLVPNLGVGPLPNGAMASLSWRF